MLNFFLLRGYRVSVLPSTPTICPEICFALLELRKHINSAISSGLTKHCIDVPILYILREMFDVLLKCGYAVTALMLDPQDETEADTESFENVIEMLLEAVQKNSAHAALLSSLPERLWLQRMHLS